MKTYYLILTDVTLGDSEIMEACYYCGDQYPSNEEIEQELFALRKEGYTVYSARVAKRYSL